MASGKAMPMSCGRGIREDIPPHTQHSGQQLVLSPVRPSRSAIDLPRRANGTLWALGSEAGLPVSKNGGCFISSLPHAICNSTLTCSPGGSQHGRICWYLEEEVQERAWGVPQHARPGIGGGPLGRTGRPCPHCASITSLRGAATHTPSLLPSPRRTWESLAKPPPTEPRWVLRIFLNLVL